MKTTFFTLFIMVLGLMTAQPVLADSGHDQDQILPETNDLPSPAEAWIILLIGYEEARDLADAGTLESMHELTDKMSVAVKTLQSDAGENERLDMALSQMQQVIVNLHVKADANDTEETARALKKFKGALLLLDAWLPENIQNSDEDDHGEDDSVSDHEDMQEESMHDGEHDHH